MEEIYAYPRDTLNIAADGENTVMDTWDDLADAGFDAGDLAQFSHVLPALADDDASVLGADEGTELQRAVERGRLRLG